MTSWIVAIANTHPQHWKIAAHHGFWDMTRRVDIQRGDTVYFWLTRGSLVSKTTATSDAQTITGADALPWEDSGVRSYTTRFHFVVTSDQPIAHPSWSVVARSAGARAGLNFGPQRIDSPEGEAYLADQFPSSSVPRSTSRSTRPSASRSRAFSARTCVSERSERSPCAKVNQPFAMRSSRHTRERAA